MTRDELEAKAALLGMWYGDKAHIFFQRDEEGGGMIVRLDADTLEPLTAAQVHERVKEHERNKEFEMRARGYLPRLPDD